MDGELRKLWVVASAKTSEESSFLSSLFFPNSMSESLQIPGSVLFDLLSRTWTWAMPVEPKGLPSRSHGGALLPLTLQNYSQRISWIISWSPIPGSAQDSPKYHPTVCPTDQRLWLMSDAGFECWGGDWVFDLHLHNAVFLPVVTKKKRYQEVKSQKKKPKKKNPAGSLNELIPPCNHPVLVVA